MDQSISEALLAQAIGREVIKCIEPEHFNSIVNSGALQLLEQIRQILDDDSLTDPECFQKIEAIVAAFQQHGISTTRHDFG